jgi:hypothetical protein
LERPRVFGWRLQSCSSIVPYLVVALPHCFQKEWPALLLVLLVLELELELELVLNDIFAGVCF